jgi:hypothetical protein
VKRCTSRMSLDYSQEKAYKTLITLGSMEAELGERLQAACLEGFLTLADQARSDAAPFSAGLASEIVALEEDLTRTQSSDGQGSLQATISQMELSEQDAAATRMIGLCVEVMQMQGPHSWQLGEGR